jgi:hypothetical protein
MQNQQCNPIIYVLLALVLYIWYTKKRYDSFVGGCSSDGNESYRCGLRGDHLHTSDIRNKYIWPKSHYRLNSSSGVVYESRNPPQPSEGTCSEKDCPAIFDRKDAKCWNCR